MYKLNGLKLTNGNVPNDTPNNIPRANAVAVISCGKFFFMSGKFDIDDKLGRFLLECIRIEFCIGCVYTCFQRRKRRNKSRPKHKNFVLFFLLNDFSRSGVCEIFPKG